MHLYHGRGASFWPRSPAVEKLLTAALRRRGYEGSRAEGVFASTAREQALRYALGESEDHLFVARPACGSVVSWVPGCGDLMLSFEGWLNEVRWRAEGGPLDPLLRDIAGDISILDVYLTRGLQDRKTAMIAARFVADLPVREAIVRDPDEVMDQIADHSGEVWITGSCDMIPALDVVPAPRP